MILSSCGFKWGKSFSSPPYNRHTWVKNSGSNTLASVSKEDSQRFLNPSSIGSTEAYPISMSGIDFISPSWAPCSTIHWWDNVPVTPFRKKTNSVPYIIRIIIEPMSLLCISLNLLSNVCSNLCSRPGRHNKRLFNHCSWLGWKPLDFVLSDAARGPSKMSSVQLSHIWYLLAVLHCWWFYCAEWRETFQAQETLERRRLNCCGCVGSYLHLLPVPDPSWKLNKPKIAFLIRM